MIVIYKQRCPRSLHYSHPTPTVTKYCPILSPLTHSSTCYPTLWARSYLWNHLAQLPHYRHVDISLRKSQMICTEITQKHGRKKLHRSTVITPVSQTLWAVCMWQEGLQNSSGMWEGTQDFCLVCTMDHLAIIHGYQQNHKTNLLFNISTSTISFIHKWLSITNMHRHCSGHEGYSGELERQTISTFTKCIPDREKHTKSLYICIACVNNYSMC